MRPRELWLWLGAAFLTIGGVLTAVAIAYFTKESHYSLSTGPQIVAAYASFILAFLCFLAAIAGWRPWLRWQRFPNLIIRVDRVGDETGTTQIRDFPPIPTKLKVLKVHITNSEIDRNVNIRAAYLLAKAKLGSDLYDCVFNAPFWQVSQDRPVHTLELPVNLAPQVSEGGELIFQLTNVIDVAEPFEARVEIHDAISGKMASFPAAIGLYSRHHGLDPTTLAERVTGPKMIQPQEGLLGPPDPTSR